MVFVGTSHLPTGAGFRNHPLYKQKSSINGGMNMSISQSFHGRMLTKHASGCVWISDFAWAGINVFFPVRLTNVFAFPDSLAIYPAEKICRSSSVNLDGTSSPEWSTWIPQWIITLPIYVKGRWIATYNESSINHHLSTMSPFWMVKSG